MVEILAKETIRQQIISCLDSGPLNAIEISQAIGIGEKEVYDHLDHISRSITFQGKKLVLHPSKCLSCGFIFKKRQRYTRPGRCPRCRQTHIQRPAYEIQKN